MQSVRGTSSSKCGLRPSAALASQCAQCYYNLYVEMCVTMDSKKLLTRHCIALCKAPTPRPPAIRHRHWLLGSVLHAKVQRFRKGDLVDSRWEDSPIYSLLCSIVCNPSLLAVWSLRRATFCFRPVANATEVCGGSQPPHLDRLSCSPGSGDITRS